MKYAVLAAAVLLSACAAQNPDSENLAFRDGDTYTPTGSNIPRKNVDKDGKRVILSRDDAGKMLQDVQAMGNALGSK
ncbi:hypothetical protein IP92_02123 [Pseudoduganella flava]|uniref:Lipoprotein n=1 Tax=Pseudoduganella flava TaxID=871742 RepID=A0A562PX34_9BURK|nr:hypothetical protein [Pseudoduganella flava]QGZ39811.1 hypothetical protein GO485_12615 [Pseudoduganella flava]TWI48730.1 hypothetical protein IP92_02123 [Pseudoduganella flava]